jgi:Xaa-Pro aminopeptidase
VTFHELQELACRLLSQSLIDLKVLNSSLDEAMEKKHYMPFYPHRIGHFLGMDVHDVGFYKTADGKDIPLVANNVLTIEPGLYLPSQYPQIPEAFRGLGVRIEDDILVTEHGFENLTKNCPKEVGELEALIGSL